MINIISIPTSQISMLLKEESVTLCKWPAFQFKCIHSLVHDKYKYNAAEIRTGLCFYRFWVKRLSAVMVTVQIMTGHWFRWRQVEQQGETILEKELFLQLIYGYPKIELWISKNRIIDIQKSALFYYIQNSNLGYP